MDVLDRRTRRGAVTAIALLGILAVIAGCSDDGEGGDSSAAETSSTTIDEETTSTTVAETTTTVADEPPEVEEFDGSVEAFYRVPDPLPEGEPGDLIRTMPIDADAGETGLRVMYHSTDAEGEDRAVTGLVYFPDGEAPDGGWPIVAWAHGTTGLAAQCAPSRGPAGAPGFGVEGVRVATDYIGLGPEGELHPYLSAAAEGNAVIDGVRAAQSIPEANAGDQWVVVGVSQGGHAALVTNEMAADRLPDTDLLGAVAIAPGAQLGETYGDDLQARVIITMVLVGLAEEDPSVDLADYLPPDVLAASSVIRDGCVGDIIADMAGVAAAPEYFTTDPRTSPAGKAWLAENDPAQVVSESPLLVVQGDQDPLVLPARTDALMERLCALGQVVERVDIPGANHDTVTGMADDQITEWIADRFEGKPPGDSC